MNKEQFHQQVRDRIFTYLSDATVVSYEDSCQIPNSLERFISEKLEHHCEIMPKLSPCPICGGDVMYYDGTRKADRELGKHFICTGCDTMFSSNVIDTVWATLLQPEFPTVEPVDIEEE